jgi:hypothetical protein
MRNAVVVPFLMLAVAVAVAFAGCRREQAPPAPPDAPEARPPVEAAPPPNAKAPGEAAASARVSSVQLGSALDASKRVVEPKSAFAPTDTIYASVDTTGSEAPVRLTARWTSEDGQVVNESSKTAGAEPSTTEFEITKPSGWPAGSYQVEILANGATASVQRFEVR